MRSRRIIPLAAAATILMALSVGSAVEKLSPANEVAKLIADLGSEEYTVREAASDELARLGRPAFAALEAAASHPDREVRYRIQRVLGIIRKQDSERRLDAFLSGKDDAEEYPLPGWNRFQKTYGGGAEHRKLFVEMQRADADLLKALDENPRRATEMLAQRTFQAQQAMQPGSPPVSLAQISVSLFVAAEPDVTLPGQSLSNLFSQCYQPAIREAIDNGARREIPRKMLGTIISRCEDVTAFQAMTVATQFKLPEGIIPATKILKNHDGLRTAPLAQHALIAIAKLGDASHLPLVEADKLLRDATQVAQFKENETTYVIQLRDVALAAAVVLSKQDLKSYFEVPPNQPLSDPQMIFLNPRLIGFATDEQRAAVFAKWEKHKSEQVAAREQRPF